MKMNQWEMNRGYDSTIRKSWNGSLPQKECRTVVIAGDGQRTRTLIGQTPLSSAHSKPIHLFLLVLAVIMVFIFVSGLVLYYN
ncbi:unnamed protein product [Nezara viridula]|uniref:Uncharacterized protein n=1 Tax=Nezara viridula TaxID=85310 RepID=A0A9P0H2H7_NEZVI|nr:unnamed protein product [Nezara viridula]